MSNILERTLFYIIVCVHTLAWTCEGEVSTGQTQNCTTTLHIIVFSLFLSQASFHLTKNCCYTLNDNNFVAETSHSYLLAVITLETMHIVL